VRTIMQNKGLALMGIGYGDGEHRAVEAATNAISSPLLEDVSIDGATGIIINITGGSNLKIHEVNEATTLIMEAAHEDAEIIFGTVIDESMNDTVKVTVIATGLGGMNAQATVSNAASIVPAAGVVAAQCAAPVNVVQSAPVVETVPPQPQVAPVPPPPPVSQQPVLEASTIAQETEPAIAPMTVVEAEAKFEDSEPELREIAPEASISPSLMGTGAESLSLASGGELARARAIAQRLGITNLTDDEYDIPTYMRRQQEREV